MLNWDLGPEVPPQPIESCLSCQTQEASSVLESRGNKNNISAFTAVLSTLHRVAHGTLTTTLGGDSMIIATSKMRELSLRYIR